MGGSGLDVQVIPDSEPSLGRSPSLGVEWRAVIGRILVQRSKS